MPHNASQNNSSSTNSDDIAANRANAEKISQLEQELDDLKKQNTHMAGSIRHISNMLTAKKGNKSPYDRQFNVSISTIYI